MHFEVQHRDLSVVLYDSSFRSSCHASSRNNLFRTLHRVTGNSETPKLLKTRDERPDAPVVEIAINNRGTITAQADPNVATLDLLLFIQHSYKSWVKVPAVTPPQPPHHSIPTRLPASLFCTVLVEEDKAEFYRTGCSCRDGQATAWRRALPRFSPMMEGPSGGT